MKPERRMTNSERNPNARKGLGFSGFGFVSDFVIRILTLVP